MKSPFCFVVKPLNGVRYNVVSQYGDKSLIKSASQEDHLSTNRFAEVLSIPLNYSGLIEKGDIIVVHHNVFRKYYDMQGRERSGPCHFKDDIYIVEVDQVYLFQRDNNWKCPTPYCFLKPLGKIQQDLLSLETEEKEVGEILFINDDLIQLGLKVGDVVSFLPDSEYEFTIDGEKLYRMRTRNITVNLTQWKVENLKKK